MCELDEYEYYKQEAVDNEAARLEEIFRRRQEDLGYKSPPEEE